ncbi:MAG TPA: LuxR C-terminal-related transcriptional regulator, partial [Sphingomonas sp.]
LFGLTPAEVRLARALLDTDCDLRASADRLEISYATVRTHLARVFAKTDARSQAELMRLLTQLSA